MKAKAAQAGCSYCPYAEMSRSMRKQRRGDWHPTDQGSSFGFCKNGLQTLLALLARNCSAAPACQSRKSAKFTMPVCRECRSLHSCQAKEVHGCQRRKFRVVQFDTLQKRNARLTEKCLNSFQGQAGESLMSQASCHFAVNVHRAR